MSRDLLSHVGENPRSWSRVRHEQVLTYLSIQLSGGKNHMMRAESLRGGIDQSDPDSLTRFLTIISKLMVFGQTRLE